MRTLFCLTLLSIAPVAMAETSVKKDVKDAAHAVKREWKKGWKATKKVTKDLVRGAADATEKAAKKTKENLD
jgi:hypothetical protein